MEQALPILRPAPLLALVVPCYNEEEVLPDTSTTLSGLLEGLKARKAIREDSFICYVDDGSKDGTWNFLLGLCGRDPYSRAVKFSANAGHQNALWAGMATAREWGVDCIISLDADLQDDVGVIGEMIEQYCQGCDIVYGVRNDRSTDTVFKRDTARFFYAIMAKLNLAMVPNHGDYRLVSRVVLKVLENFEEENLFLRGLFPVLGFRSAKVYYKRLSRQKGVTKYPLSKLFSLAWQGITSCSAAPLRIAGLMSLVCMAVALLLCVATLIKYWAGETIQGWSSLIIVSLFLGAVQLFCLAVIGEYIAKIFTEVRRRPRYIIEKIIPTQDDPDIERRGRQ